MCLEWSLIPAMSCQQLPTASNSSGWTYKPWIEAQLEEVSLMPTCEWWRASVLAPDKCSQRPCMTVSTSAWTDLKRELDAYTQVKATNDIVKRSHHHLSIAAMEQYWHPIMEEQRSPRICEHDDDPSSVMAAYRLGRDHHDNEEENVVCVLNPNSTIVH